MKMIIRVALAAFGLIPLYTNAQTNNTAVNNEKTKTGNLYIYVHEFAPGKVKYEDLVKAHTKNITLEKKYGVHSVNYWVDESKGLVYYLSSASDSESIKKMHTEAHVALPSRIFEVTDGVASNLNNQKNFFLDVHLLGPGNVTAKDVVAVHKKDLAVEKKYDVNLINYWVDEKNGVVMCLAQAKDSTSLIETHREAHGLLPNYVLKVKPGK